MTSGRVFGLHRKPSGQCAHIDRDLINICDAAKEKADTDLRVWFGGRRAGQVVEEIIGLGRYGKTLIVISSSTLADDEKEDNDLEESWTPRFR